MLGSSRLVCLLPALPLDRDAGLSDIKPPPSGQSDSLNSIHLAKGFLECEGQILTSCAGLCGNRQYRKWLVNLIAWQAHLSGI
jgi:hypothetical protein